MTASASVNGQDLAQRLAEAEATIEALLTGQIDAVVDSGSTTPVLLVKAQEALRESESALRAERDRAQRYLDTAEVILLALDMQGRITLVNRYACSVFGWTASELLGRDFIEMCVPAGIRDETRRMMGGVHMGPATSSVENAIVTRSGEVRMVEWRNTLLRDDGGRVASTLSSGTDITERKRAEQEARHAGQVSARADQDFRTLFAANPLPMWIFDLATLRFLEVNDAAVQHYGYQRDEFLAMTIEDVRPPEDVPSMLAHPQAHWQAVQKTGGIRHRIKSGRDIDVDIKSHAITFAGQSAALVVAQDVTERTRAEEDRQSSAEALRTAEERMRFALEAAGVGIWDSDYKTGVHLWSPTLEAHYGLQPGTFAGTFEAFVERIHPDDRASIVETVGNAMKSGGDFSTLNRTIWPDGSVRWLSGSGRIQLADDGTPSRAVGVTLDVTERHKLEEQYQQAQKMEAVGRLAGGVAHDFNNLLMVITGYSDLVLESLMKGDNRRADLEQIRKAADAATSLTRQLLAFSRQQVIEPSMVVLEAVVTAASKMLQRLIGEDVELVTILNQDTATIHIDAGQLEQVIMNLAVNARDAMPTGGKLTIETSVVEFTEKDARAHWPATQGRFAIMVVSDTGVGMDEMTRGRIFEPFFTTKDQGKGTGLGLATVYGIVEQSNGFIRVDSEPGHGAAFTILWPLLENAQPATRASKGEAGIPTGRETILLVEDSDGVRDIARRVLEKQGYTVIESADPIAALEMARTFAGTIHLLLTDVVMPGMSGRVLSERFAEHHPKAKLIFMSGYTDDAVLLHGVMRAQTPYLQKPFSPRALAGRVREVLDSA